MISSVLVAYPPESDHKIEVLYTIDYAGDVQTINCSVDGKGRPQWLQLRKFSMSSLREHGALVPLYSELNNSRNMDTMLFIDTVYSDIMKLERRGSERLYKK